MNHHHHDTRIAFGRGLRATAALALLALAPTALAQNTAASSRDNRAESTSTYSINDKGLSVKVSERTVVSTGTDGKETRDETREIKVVLDGQEVPANRLREKDGLLEVLDGEGNVLRSIRVPRPGMANAQPRGAGDVKARFFSSSGGSSSGGGSSGASSSGGGSSSSDASSSGGGSRFGGASSQQNGARARPIAPGNVITVQPSAVDPFGGVVGTTPPRVMIGITLESPDESLARHLGVAATDATVVASVTPDLPAAKAGIKQYDVIVAVDGVRPAGPRVVREVLAKKEPGQTVKFEILSGGEKKAVGVDVAAWDATKLGLDEGSTFAPVWLDSDLPVMDEQLRRMIEEMTKGGRFDMELFAPGSGGGTDLYRFIVPPAQAAPQTGAPSAAPVDDDRMRSLEERIQQLNETIRLLEERLRTMPAVPPAAGQPAAPKPRA
jgi:hypothetical protein